MKKKLIMKTLLTVLSSMLILIFGSTYLIKDLYYQDSKEELAKYLKIATQVFEENNYQEVSNLISNKQTRVTFIDVNGKVVFDSDKGNIEEPHLQRPEIENLNQVYIRYSDTLKTNMLYIADFKDNHYIRISIYEKSLTSFITTYIFYVMILFILILWLSIIFEKQYIDNILKPLNKSLKILTKITDKTYSEQHDIDILLDKVVEVNEIIEKQMLQISEEKEKTDIISKNISQAIILLDNDKNIILINEQALDLFELKRANIIGKSYIYLTLDKQIENSLFKAEIKQELNAKIKDKYYLVEITKVENNILLTFVDITNLKEVEEMKKQFFQNASHELKSPLTTILGYSQMINEQILTEEKEILDSSKRIYKEAKKMEQLVKDMLEISRLESNERSQLLNCDLRSIILEALNDLDNLVVAKELTLELELKNYNIIGNHQHLYSLIKNILENSFKYNKDQGQVKITLNEGQLIVKDTGIGIKEKDLQHIFERFYRVDKSFDKYNSTGLGLAIVKHICNLYDYEIKVNSEVGKYTEVIVKFK